MNDTLAAHASAQPSLEQFLAKLEASPLKLAYVFTPAPNPILASPAGGTANVVGIQVMISNPGRVALAFKQLTITIRTGEDSSAAITSAPALPAPVYDRTTIPLNITVAAGVITIAPREPEETFPVTGPIIFTLPGITINTVPGTVPIAIKEIDATDKKTESADTYSLIKYPSNTYAVDFRAEPNVLYDYGRSVKLHWNCTTLGQGVSYAVKSATWQPRNCLNDGVCFTCADGTIGVTTPGLGGSTYFELMVIGPNAEGHRVKLTSIFAHVDVLAPEIVPTSSYRQITRNGRFVEMRWLANNAVRCSIKLNGIVIRENLPTDTYNDGYRFYIDLLPPGTYNLVLVAYGSTGAYVERVYSDFKIGSSPTIASGGVATSVAISPDGTKAYTGVMLNAAASVAMSSGEGASGERSAWGENAVAPGLMTAESPSASSMVRTMLEAGPVSNSLTVVDVISLTPGREQRTKRIATSMAAGVMKISADGRYLLAAPAMFQTSMMRQSADALIALELATDTLSVRKVQPAESMLISVAPLAGSVAVMVGAAESVPRTLNMTLFLVDATGAAVPNPTLQISADALVTAIAATPDGSKVVGVDEQHGSMLIVDMTARRVTHTIPVNSKPCTVALTPDGALALVTGISDTLRIIDMANPTAPQASIQIGGIKEGLIAVSALFASLMALSRDGKYAYILREMGDVLVIVDIPKREVAYRLSIPSSSAVAVGPDGTIVLSNGVSTTIL